VRIALIAVGRLSRTPEGALAADYVARAAAGGRALGLAPIELIEVESRKPGKEAEGEAILAALPEGAHLIACDEHGEQLTSRKLSERIAALRDGGEKKLCFVIGGADGLSPAVLAAARSKLAFGALTWPHALARAMLAEQIYRSVTLLAGSPYHRD
jgi:23S rRNA (pseudouridine1915-N3)-methyltransferase